MLPTKRLERVQRSMNVQAFIASESDALSFQQNVKLGDNGGNPQTVAQWDTKPSQIETNVYFLWKSLNDKYQQHYHCVLQKPPLLGSFSGPLIKILCPPVPIYSIIPSLFDRCPPMKPRKTDLEP